MAKAFKCEIVYQIIELSFLLLIRFFKKVVDHM